MFGLDERTGEPVRGPLCTVSLFGLSRSGKTNTAAWYGLQAGAELGAELLCADPHAGHPDSLSALLGFVSDEVAATPEETAALIRAAHAELGRRKREHQHDGRPLVLLIDERHESLPRQRDAQVQLQELVTGGTKYGVVVVLVAQLVAQPDLPAWLRRGSGAVVVHALHGQDQYGALGLRRGSYPVDPALLVRGQALLRVPDVGGVRLARIPQVTAHPPRPVEPRQRAALAAARRPAVRQQAPDPAAERFRQRQLRAEGAACADRVLDVARELDRIIPDLDPADVYRVRVLRHQLADLAGELQQAVSSKELRELVAEAAPYMQDAGAELDGYYTLVAQMQAEEWEEPEAEELGEWEEAEPASVQEWALQQAGRQELPIIGPMLRDMRQRRRQQAQPEPIRAPYPGGIVPTRHPTWVYRLPGPDGR